MKLRGVGTLHNATPVIGDGMDGQPFDDDPTHPHPLDPDHFDPRVPTVATPVAGEPFDAQRGRWIALVKKCIEDVDELTIGFAAIPRPGSRATISVGLMRAITITDLGRLSFEFQTIDISVDSDGGTEGIFIEIVFDPAKLGPPADGEPFDGTHSVASCRLTTRRVNSP